MGKLDDTPWLHITSQFREHGMAYVTGTRHGLLELRAAIDAALNGDGQADGSVFATDGEGYQVRIRLSNTVAGCGEPVYFEAIARQAYHVERQFYESITRDRRTPIHKDESHD